MTDWQRDWKQTPCWILNYCNLDRGFRQLLEWLLRAGMTKIAVIDNDSQLPSLREFYATSPLMREVTLVHAGSNMGHEAMWKLGLHLPPVTPAGSRYILTDPDCVPDPACPLDLVRKMHEVFDRFLPVGAKVGPALRIDDLPDHFALRDHMRHCEADYWVRKYAEGDCWNAAIDTTMSLSASGWSRWPLASSGGVQHVRLDFPYVVQHRPWYSDSAHPTEEELFYREHALPQFSSSLPATLAAAAEAQEAAGTGEAAL